MKQLGWKPVYEDINNPLSWMDWVLSGKKHTNFFEERVTEYSHDTLKGEIDYKGYEMSLEDTGYKKSCRDYKEPLKVFSAGWCSYCKKLKQFLDYNLIPYVELDVDEMEKFDHKTIPQVFEGENHLGGYTETLAHFTKGD